VGQLPTRRRGGVKDMLMPEWHSAKPQEREYLESIAVVVSDAEQLGIGIESDHLPACFMCTIVPQRLRGRKAEFPAHPDQQDSSQRVTAKPPTPGVVAMSSAVEARLVVVLDNTASITA